jgi:hypothetical protein
MSNDHDLQQFKDLQEKNQKITEQAFKINAQIEHAQNETKKILEMLQEKYQISSIEELKELIEQRKSSNTAKLHAFEKAVLEKEKEVIEKTNVVKNNSQ